MKRWSHVLLFTGLIFFMMKGQKMAISAESSKSSNDTTTGSVLQKPKVNFFSVKSPFLSGITRINVVLPFGATQEPTANQGVTDFALDLLFRGATGLSSKEISGQLAKYGASAGFSVSKHHTILRIEVLSEYLDPCLKLVKQVIETPTFPKEEFELLKEQYISGIKGNLEKNQSLLWRAYRKWFYAKAPMNTFVSGTLASITSLKLEDVKSWYQKAFQAENLKVFYISNVPETELEVKMLGFLEWVKLGKVTPNVSEADVIKPNGIQIVIVNKPSSKTGDFMFVQPGVHFGMNKSDFYAAFLGNEALGGGGMQSRLFQELREKRGWTYHASSGFWGSLYHKFPSPWVAYAYPSVQYTQDAVTLAYELIKKYIAEGITEKEMQLYRTNMIRVAPFRESEPSKKLNLLFDEEVQGRYVMDRVEREIILKSLTLEDIAKNAKTLLSDSNFVFLIVGDAQKLQAWLPKVFGDAAQIKVIQPEEVL